MSDYNDAADVPQVALRGPIVTRSLLNASAEDVWALVSTAAGINDELAPILRMTAPRALRERGLAAVVPGERLCRSWVLLLGLLPVDYDDITLVRLDPPHGFLERSAMLSQRVWQHERTLEAAPEGCVLCDRISYQPRLPVPDAILRPLYRAVFGHRHRRLRRRFGGRALTDAAGGSAAR
jgi:ligand-binding SRPBCC domain-containing protein